jgi:hypothetical protein
MTRRRWVGWYRRGPALPWIRAAEGDCLHHCARLLGQATRTLRPRPRNIDEVLTGGAPPFLPDPSAMIEIERLSEHGPASR